MLRFWLSLSSLPRIIPPLPLPLQYHISLHTDVANHISGSHSLNAAAVVLPFPFIQTFLFFPCFFLARSFYARQVRGKKSNDGGMDVGWSQGIIITYKMGMGAEETDSCADSDSVVLFQCEGDMSLSCNHGQAKPSAPLSRAQRHSTSCMIR